jgi:CheY-like chemotaxis protein
MLAHKGSLTVESVPGKGSTFYAHLPYVKPLVFLAESDPGFLKDTRELLRTIDVTVITADNGLDAWEKLKQAPPHLLITDIHLPEMDGLELITRLKADDATNGIPVIVLTHAGQEERESAFRLGANDFVSKAVAREELIPRARRIIS